MRCLFWLGASLYPLVKVEYRLTSSDKSVSANAATSHVVHDLDNMSAMKPSLPSVQNGMASLPAPNINTNFIGQDIMDMECLRFNSETDDNLADIDSDIQCPFNYAGSSVATKTVIPSLHMSPAFRPQRISPTLCVISMTRKIWSRWDLTLLQS